MHDPNKRVTGPPVRPGHADSALDTLHRSTVALCGPDRNAWVQRIAGGTATHDDKAVLRWLPADALKTVGLTPRKYVKMIDKMLRAF